MNFSNGTSKIKRVCFSEALYPFTFYLLFSSIEEIEKTMFIMDRRVSPKIKEKLPHYVDTKIEKKSALTQPFYGWWMRIYCHFKHPYLYSSEVFGLDFKWEYLQGLNLKYIEDGPNSFNLWETGPMFQDYLKYRKSSILFKMICRIFRGNYYRQPIATSSSVKEIYTTAEYNKFYHIGKVKHILNWKTLWENSSKEKQDYILNIFNVTREDLEELKGKKTILLTQAFYDDRMMTKEEQIEMYRKILNNYDSQDVVIKPHPRDFLNYKKEFPDIYYFDKIIPIQLLAVWGVDFDNVATVTSSAALAFGIEKKIDWYGSYSHPGIIKNEGLRTLEDAIDNYKKQNNL